ncbi:hypothetical protein [Clostridium cochlearium]|uniref:Uncharacterized protein n=1 Tax=Clostridium cochlearium TaxID=1494 RepID=A0A7Y3V6X2_CLOCO|nr:hypothetical protein [Clostridium cochlearium]NOH15838.1 hypothetical protein [Clostridium cochlearium]
MKLNYKKIGIFILVFIISILIKINAVYAKDLSINAESKLNGKAKLGNIVPIDVDIKSEDDMEGKLCLYISEEKYEHSIKISSGVSNKYTFLVPIKKGVKEIKISIEEKDKVVKEKKFPLAVHNSNSLFIGVLSNSENNYNYINNIKLKSFDINGSEVISLRDKELSFEVLKNFNFIILDDFNSENLSNNDKEALDKWLKHGGIIFIGQGKYSHKNFKGPFENIKKITYVERGSIVPINFELSDKNNIARFDELITKNINNEILYSLKGNIDLKEEATKAEQLKNVANNMLKVNKNIIYFLITVLIVYLVCLIAMVLLKKSNMHMWLAIIIVFSVVIFITYYIEGVGKEKITMASFNEYSNEYYISKSLINVYPNKKDVSLASENWQFISQQGTGKHSLDPVDKKIIYKNPKEINYLYNVSLNSLEKHINNKLKILNNHLIGEIKNPFPYELEDCILIAGDNLIKIGNIKSGETLEINYELDDSLKGKGDYEYLSIMEKQVSDKNKQDFLKYYLNLHTSEKFNCKLMGFSNRRVYRDINNKKRKINSNNMEIIPMEIEFSQIEIPYGFIKPIIKKDITNNENNIREYTFKKNESINLYYILPKNMKLNEIRFDNSFKDGKFYIERFNYDTNSWNKVDKLVLDNIKDLNGKVLNLRIKGEGRLIIPSISLKGALN